MSILMLLLQSHISPNNFLTTVLVAHFRLDSKLFSYVFREWHNVGKLKGLYPWDPRPIVAWEPRAKRHSVSTNPLAYGMDSSPSAFWFPWVHTGPFHGLIAATPWREREPSGGWGNIPGKDKHILEPRQGLERSHWMKKYWKQKIKRSLWWIRIVRKKDGTVREKEASHLSYKGELNVPNQNRHYKGRREKWWRAMWCLEPRQVGSLVAAHRADALCERAQTCIQAYEKSWESPGSEKIRQWQHHELNTTLEKEQSRESNCEEWGDTVRS